MPHLDPANIGAALAGVSAFGCAWVTARNNRKSNQQSATVTEAASQREFQLAFLKTLQDEIAKLNGQRTDLRAEMAALQNELDGERSKRRAVESKLQELTETIERLQTILNLIPAVLENPDIQRFLQTDFTP